MNNVVYSATAKIQTCQFIRAASVGWESVSIALRRLKKLFLTTKKKARR